MNKILWSIWCAIYEKESALTDEGYPIEWYADRPNMNDVDYYFPRKT